MDFAAMKRRELQALCKRHGLAAGGTNAYLVARLTATLSGSGGAAEAAVGVVVGKGCLKRSAGGASGGDLDERKKVTFELEEDEEAEVAVTGRGRRRSQVMSPPAVAKTRGRQKAGEAPPVAKGNGGERRRTRSQAGGDSADERDSGEAGADAPVRRSVTRKTPAKAEQEEVEVGDAVGRKHQLKRKTRENDTEDVDVSVQVGVSRRSTRSSGLLLEPAALSSPVEKKRGRRKAADVKEKTCVEEQPTEALHSVRTLRSGVVVVAPVPPIVSESKSSRLKVQEEEPAVENVAKVEISRRTTRSSSVAAAVTSPSVTAKKRGRKTDDVHLDEGPDKKMDNKRQSSRLTARSGSHHLASSGEEASLEQVAAPSKGLPPRRSRRNPSEANLMLNSSTTSESNNWSRAPTEGNSLKIARPTMLNATKDGVEDGVEKPDRHLGLKKSKLWNASATVATNGGEIPFSASSGKASASAMQIEVPGPVRRSTRKSVVPSSVEHETKDMHEDVEKKQTVTKPVGRSTRRSVAPVILEKESKGLTKEMVPEVHVKRPTRKSVVPAMLEKRRKGIITEIIPEARVKRSTWKPALPMANSENNDHCEVVSSENLQSDKGEELEKQPIVKQPVRRVTRKSAVLAIPEEDRKGVPDMLNNENGDRTEMRSDKAGHLEKQQVVKEPVRKSTGKSVVPDVIEKENKGLHEELKSEVSVRTPICKSVVPDAVNKEVKDHNEFLRTEELSVKTRSAHTRLQVALQNDESLRRTTRKSSKLAISPPQSKPTASRGRPAKRRWTTSLQEDIPAEEQKEDQIASGAHTDDVIEVATSTDLAIGVLPFTAEKSDLRDSQLNSELEGMVVVEPGLRCDKEDNDTLVFELEGTVGTTEKPPSSLPIPDCKLVGSLSEEAVHSIENDAGKCSPNFEQSPTGLHFLFSKGIAERSATHNAFACPENSVEESDVHKVECRVETVVSSKSDSYQGSDENSVRVEESGGCTFSFQQNYEQEGVSVSSCQKDLVASAQLDLSEDADRVTRDVISKDLICKEEEKRDFIPSSDITVPHEISPVIEPAENASGVSGAVFCISQSTPISDEVNSDSSRLESPDALDNHIASSNTEAVQQDNKEEWNLHNGVTHGIHASGMSEAAQVEISKIGKMLLPDVETSAFRDAQLNRGQEGNEFEEHSFSCGEDGSGKNNISELANEYVMDSCQEQEPKLPHDLSVVKSPKGSTTCQGIGRISGSIVKGNTIAMDAPGTAMQGDNLSPSATALLRNKENTPDFKIDAPELSSDHLFTMDLSVRAVQSVSGRLREAGLAVGNPDNKLRMEQVQQDDVQVLEGTLENTPLGSATPESNQQCRLSEEAEPQPLKNERCSSFGLQSLFSQDDAHTQEGNLEKAALGSVTPECKHKSGLPDEAEPHSSKNETCSTSVEQSPFGLQALFSQEIIEEPSENVALAVHAKNRVDESKDIGMEYGVEKPPVPESVSDHDSSVNFSAVSPVPESVSDHDSSANFSAVSKSEDCAHTSDQGNEYEGLTKSCQEQEQMACQLDLLEAANCMDFTNPEEVSYDKENKRPVHSTDISSSCEQIDANGPVKHASGLGDGLLSSSLIASNNDTDVHLSSNPYQFESTDFLDEPKGFSSTEALQQGLKEQCDEPKENEVTYGACPSNMIEADSVKNLESEVPPLPAEETSNMLESLFLRESSKGSDMHGDLVLPSAESEDDSNPSHVELQVEKMVSSEPDSSKGSDMHGNLVLPSAENEDDSNPSHVELQVEKMVSSEPDSSKGSDMHGDLVLLSAENEDDSTVCHVELQVEKMVSSEPGSRQGSHEDLTKDEQLIAPLLAAETSALPDEQANPELEAGEFEKCNFSSEDTSGKIGTGYVKNNLFKVHEDSHMECIQGKKLPDDLPAPKSPEESTIGQDTDTSALPDVLPNPELEGSEIKECYLSSEDTSGIYGTGYVKTNLFQSHVDLIQGKELPDVLPAPKSPEQSTVGQDAETSTLQDEQPNPELEAGEFEERDLSSEDTSGKTGTGYVKNNPFEVHKDSLMDCIQGKELPNDLSAPKSPEQSTIGQDAETSALPDEQPNPELEAGELKECNLSSDVDTSGMFGTGYVKTNIFQSHMDLTQGKGLPNDLPAPESPEQSTIGQDAETSALLDEEPNPELEAGEFEERNLSSEDTSSIFGAGYLKTDLFKLHEDSHMDLVQGKERLNGLPAPKSPEQSTIGQDAETSALPDEQLNPELEAGEFEECDFSSEDTSGLFGTGYVEDNLFQLHGYSDTDPIHGDELPNYLSAPESPKQSTIGQDANVLGSETSPLSDEEIDPKLEGEEFKERDHSCVKAASNVFSSGSVKNNSCHWDDKEEYNEHNDDQATAAMLSSGMTEPTLIEGSESGMAPLSAAGTPAFTDEQLNSKLEEDKEPDFSFNIDTSYISDTELMENIDLFSLPEDAHTETCYERELPIGTPAAKSAGESAVCPDGSVLGSVGTCQTSGRRRIDEINKKLLSFKISSTVKGSYIAMDSASKKQGDNLGPIPFLGNREDAPAANADHPAEVNTDWSVAEGSSRQGTTDGL